MAPPAARQRYNANKSDNQQMLTRKPKKLNSINNNKKENKRSHNKSKTENTRLAAEQTSAMVPGVNTAFKTFVSARFWSAIWAYISDCDETYNYWEPLHYVIYGHGLQTWEYSPEYALRSYTYLLLVGVPGWLYKQIASPNPVLIFYMVRCMLGFACALMERFMYKSICQEFGIHIGRLWLIFQLFSVGMFISSTALLPSSFSMYFSNAALAAWWQKKYNLAIFFVAISTFLGWPFAVLMGVPIALDMLYFKGMWREFFKWSVISAITILLPMIAIDSNYFGKFVFAPFNLVIYNVFTSHGPNIFGTEPLSYYLINGFLNFNIVWFLALITPVMLVLDYYLVPARSKSTLNFPRYMSLAPLYLWLAVFFAQPHKEERFLFPVYPLISLCGAITVDVLQRLYFRLKTLLLKVKGGNGAYLHYLDHSMFIAIFVLLVSTMLSLSRVFSLYRNYHAPMDLMVELNIFKQTEQYDTSNEYNVCIGKDWYRYPSSFFLPAENFRIRFLKSEFDGMLPAYYVSGANATQFTPPYFNDMNRADERTYFNYENCHFLIDLDEGKYTELEPNYANRTQEWSIVKSLSFLLPEKSHRLFRAFYVPFVTDKYINYGDYNLLKRKKMHFS